MLKFAMLNINQIIHLYLHGWIIYGVGSGYIAMEDVSKVCASNERQYFAIISSYLI